jgi:hypothetical protein
MAPWLSSSYGIVEHMLLYSSTCGINAARVLLLQHVYYYCTQHELEFARGKKPGAPFHCLEQ